MKDSYERNIEYIRVSVTDRCNLRCSYCMPREGVPTIPHSEILTLEETLRLCRIFAGLGVSKVKVTGGEPLVRRGVTAFVGELKKVPGIRQVTLTSNGILLPQHLPGLLEAGLDGANISLDTLNRAVFEDLTRTDGLNAVLDSLDTLAQSGIPVKINCVPIRNVNGGELPAIAALAKEKVQAVRFIELMPVGLASCFEGIPADTVLKELEKAYGKLQPFDGTLGNGPARYYALDGFKGKIGIIRAVSQHFCDTCNRVRLTSDGWLKLCLSHEEGVNLKEPLRGGAADEELAELITQTVARKPKMHSFGDACGVNALQQETMNQIGG